MANALQVAGSTGSKPTRYAPILIHKFFKGLWTQRNPFTDAGTSFLVEKFYSGTSFDGLIDGSNIELTNRLTLRRRPGATVYNSQTFPAINRFYEFRSNTAPNVETIKVVADTPTAVYDATGPSTKTLLLTKTTTNQTNFQSVGSTLYFSDGVDLPAQWLRAPAWQASTSYEIGQLVTDSNGNIQYLLSVTLGNITNVPVQSKTAIVTLNSVALCVPGMTIRPTGLGHATFLSGNQYIIQSVNVSSNTITFFIDHVNYGPTAETQGTILTLDEATAGTSGSSAPTWATGGGGTTTDNNLGWVNISNAGNATYQWPAAYGAGSKSIQPPTLSAVPNGTLLNFWQPLTAYASGSIILAKNGWLQRSQGAGTSGATLPQFTTAPASLTFLNDGTVLWLPINWLGNSTAVNTPWKAGVAVTGDCACIDANGNLQFTTSSGTTGGSAPSWNTTYGGTTADNGLTWTNEGPFLPLAFTGWQYGYSFHAIDGSVTTLSRLSGITNAVVDGVQVTGTAPLTGLPPIDSIWLFRTADGGATLEYLTQIANQGIGVTWSYVDQNADSALNEFIQGPIDHSNDAQPLGFMVDCYHLGRVFGHVGNILYYSGGADTLVGNGNGAFPPNNNFVMPGQITRQVPISIGLLIFTTSGVYFSGIGGANADTPTAPTPFMDGKLAGLMSYNALDIVGSTIYLINSKKKLLQIDISTGAGEIGFPIGDIMASTFNPATCYTAWHEQDSTDSALYAAMPGAAGTGFWYRMNPAPAPESGMMWSPKATSAAGFSAIQSIETSPGTHQLLMGPPTATGPILARNTSTFQDNGTNYTAYADIGSIVLAHPGQVALLDFISTYCVAVGSRPTVSVLMGEIGGHAEMLVKGAALPIFVPEPPENGPAEASTIYNDRWWMSGTQASALCQHLQIEIAWPAENQPNELLSYALFGAHYQEI